MVESWSVIPDSQPQYSHRDTLIELNKLLSEKIFELEQSQSKIKQLQLEHTASLTELTRKHETSLRNVKEEYEALFDVSRRQQERLNTSERLSTKLTVKVEQLMTEMEDFKALRVCTLVQDMIRRWDSDAVEGQLRGEKDLVSFARALCLQNRVQSEEIDTLQTQLSQVRIEKQLLERKLFKLHSEGNVQKDGLERVEGRTNHSPSETPTIRSIFSHPIIVSEPERSGIKTTSLFKTKGRRQLGGTVPDGMGGRSKVIEL